MSGSIRLLHFTLTLPFLRWHIIAGLCEMSVCTEAGNILTGCATIRCSAFSNLSQFVVVTQFSFRCTVARLVHLSCAGLF